MQNIKRTGKWPFKADHMDLQQSIQHEKTYGLSTNKVCSPQGEEFYFSCADNQGTRPLLYPPFHHGWRRRRSIPSRAQGMSMFVLVTLQSRLR